MPTPQTPPPPEDLSPLSPEPPLHVALDIRPYHMSGLGTYVRELLGGFAATRLPILWTLIGPDELRDELSPGLAVHRWIDYRAPMYAPGSFLSYPDPGRIDVFHYPHYNLPWVRTRRKIITLFDLFHLKYGSWAKRRYQALFLSRLRWSRTAILTPSAKTRDELIHVTGISKNRITLVEPGPGRSPQARTAAASAQPPLSLTGRPLRSPWLLAMGIDQPHKNLEFLISALSLYYQRRTDAPPLVWVGLSPESCARRSQQVPAHMRRHVAIVPYAEPATIEALMAEARALVFPSLDEGFGFPPMEAMARGVPVLCSRREPMISLLGEAALYFEPTESASLWRMLDRLLDAPSIQQEVIGRGRRQVRRYGWTETARQTYAVYLRLAGRACAQEQESEKNA